MNLVIIKYNAGNIQSLTFALKRLGITPVVSDNPEDILSADKIIFPGVGEARSAMNHLEKTSLLKLFPVLKQPFLGICLGLQLMCKHSEERDTTCLGIFDLEVKRFDGHQKVPHMGWNTLTVDRKNTLSNGIQEDSHMYFVHSYFAELGGETLARSHYMQAFSAVLQKDNFYAVQAHPEKSGDAGVIILENFVHKVNGDYTSN